MTISNICIYCKVLKSVTVNCWKICNHLCEGCQENIPLLLHTSFQREQGLGWGGVGVGGCILVDIFHFVDIDIQSVFSYIFIADYDFFTKFCSSDPRFNRNNLTSLYLKSETCAHMQMRNYSFIHTIYKFHDIMLVGNLHWGIPLDKWGL